MQLFMDILMKMIRNLQMKTKPEKNPVFFKMGSSQNRSMKYSYY